MQFPQVDEEVPHYAIRNLAVLPSRGRFLDSECVSSYVLLT